MQWRLLIVLVVVSVGCERAPVAPVTPPRPEPAPEVNVDVKPEPGIPGFEPGDNPGSALGGARIAEAVVQLLGRDDGDIECDQAIARQAKLELARLFGERPEGPHADTVTRPMLEAVAQWGREAKENSRPMRKDIDFKARQLSKVDGPLYVTAELKRAPKGLQSAEVVVVDLQQSKIICRVAR